MGASSTLATLLTVLMLTTTACSSDAPPPPSTTPLAAATETPAAAGASSPTKTPLPTPSPIALLPGEPWLVYGWADEKGWYLCPGASGRVGCPQDRHRRAGRAQSPRRGLRMAGPSPSSSRMPTPRMGRSGPRTRTARRPPCDPPAVPNVRSACSIRRGRPMARSSPWSAIQAATITVSVAVLDSGHQVPDRDSPRSHRRRTWTTHRHGRRTGRRSPSPSSIGIPRASSSMGRSWRPCRPPAGMSIGSRVSTPSCPAPTGARTGARSPSTPTIWATGRTTDRRTST